MVALNRLIVLCVAVVCIIAPYTRRKANERHRSPSPLVASPTIRTLSEWLELSKEALTLACNAVNISATGPLSTLAGRLFMYYQTAPPAPVIPVANASQPNSEPAVPVVSGISFVSRGAPSSFVSPSLFVSPGPVPASIMIPPRSLSSTTLPSSTNNIHAATSLTELIRSEIQRCLSVEQRVPPALYVPPATEVQPPIPLPFISPNPPPHSAATLPPLPQNIIQQIQSGKFVRFESLLLSAPPLSADEYTIQVAASNSSEPTVSLVPRHHNRPAINDFITWMSAWNNFVQALLVSSPELSSDLWQYQSLITRFASQYVFSAWYTYDQLFRYQMANNPRLSWATFDDNLFNMNIRGATLRPLCFSCHQYGHLSGQCPSASRPHTTPIASRRPPFPAPQHTPICRYFNSNECFVQQCRYSHKCSLCQGNHPAYKCSQHNKRA